MAETQVLGWGTQTAPAQRVTKANETMTLLAVDATFDGTAAAGPFLAAVQIISDAGVEVGTFPISTAIAAGSSARVTFAPFLGRQGTAPSTGTGVPPSPALDDYVFKNANTVVTAVGNSDRTNPIIIGNILALDGSTRIKIEFFAPGVESVTSPTNQAVGFELWDNFPGTPVNKGTLAYVSGNVNGATSQMETSVYAAVILTPAAGSYQFAVYAFKNVIGGTCTVLANTFVDGTGNFAPAWYRVTTT